MSTPYGLDFGNSSSVLAVARNRGIDVVVNEVSNRSTPTIVGFGERNRYLGESGKTKQTSNIKNTVDNLKRIIGMNYDDPDFAIESKFFNSSLVKLKDGKVGVKVNLNGDEKVFTATQIAAMFIGKSKQIVEDETKSEITDICISVPSWYNEEQRYAMADAAKIANLNPVRIVTDTTAAAVSYGVFKTDLPEAEEPPRVVAFIDIGHSTYTCSIAKFKNGECRIVGTAFDKHFGGRDFDHAITEHFADEFKDKYEIDIRSNPKAYNRVLTAAEKLKKVLSANTTAVFNVESVMNDIDVSSQMTREELEELAQPLLNRINSPITRALNQAKLTLDDIDFVEMIGGTTRIPAIKDSISKAFDKQLSTTLNQDEAVAKGAAFICAIHSPILRVRPFKFEDIHPVSVSYYWDKQGEDEDHLEVFPANSYYPSTKMITLHRTGNFHMKAKYTNKGSVPTSGQSTIAKWELKGVKLPKGAELVPVKIKLRCDPSGFHTIEEAHTLEDVTVEEPIPLPEDAPEDAEQEFKEVIKTVKKDKLSIKARTFGLPTSKLNEYIELENELIAQDKLIAETIERKNELEEYIYSLRSKLEGDYAPFASSNEKAKLNDMLTKSEDWLYDEGYDTTKSEYVSKYEELASMGNIIKTRYLEDEEKKRKLAKAKQNQSSEDAGDDADVEMS
ncbi:hypothetical protein Kpol_242p3 [Vanderwaltozyma polyspora DSM 70294]|uniref:Heat shock protein homolog SSE1 n=1 Tax=Vanderwaltozyma polyspora (strain ATCC 22028 / DSM 70294 / BCRC 21397 / CBS 2163 / NBRC 10782 / NRRL Y-8283 / UCD 57-17) TaxID=436907 RepID=A7TTC3_VANPO|nr:uncharacterized protein Kpol_242p3 [Vanderwaltozyma polyspora DSM 70294]EDO14480.1 hypothetical protein Kpol_242p3 [Vanderwaltozyma polyspora DSM 70294]